MTRHRRSPTWQTTRARRSRRPPSKSGFIDKKSASWRSSILGDGRPRPRRKLTPEQSPKKPKQRKGADIMSIHNVADLVVETLLQAGVKRIYGVVGDSLNGLMEAIRVRETIEWMHVRHEEVAAFAACGEAQVTGELAVCAGSCGPGNLHLINGLFDAHRT